MNNKGLGIYRLLKHAIKDVHAGPFSATLPDPTCEISDQTRPDPPITSPDPTNFSSCLAIVSAVMVGGLFLWPALRYGTGYQTV